MLENQTEPNNLEGKPFPCPVCGMILPLEITQKQKPYCTCNLCGIQLFFRGKAGIKRLHALLQNEKPIEEYFPETNIAVTLYNRLLELNKKHEKLEEKQGIVFRDEYLDNAVSVLNADIGKLDIQLETGRKEAEKKK